MAVTRRELRPDSPVLADAAASWRAAYVHIPFCRRRCPYCDFAVVAADEGGDAPMIDRYVAAVMTEIEREPRWGPLDAVNFGGGTPSALDPAALGNLLEALDDRFGLAPDAEVSLEANPEDGTAAAIAAWQSAGVTRVSWGVQSFDDEVLAALGRVHSAAQAAASVACSVEADALSVGLDLIFGTPGESFASWQATVARTLSLGIDHLSAYSLTVEPGTALFRSVAAGAPAPDPDDQADKYLHLQRAAAETALVRYEVSNYAKAGHPCRYNLGTWAQGEYLGFGLGAHSHRADNRSRNARHLESYLTAVEGGESPRTTDRATVWEREQERVMLGLRRAAGVVAGECGRRLVKGPEGRRLADAGVLVVDVDRLVVRRPLLTDLVTRAVLSVSPHDC